MKLLIIGASRFLGRNLIFALQNEKYNIISELNLTFFTQDIPINNLTSERLINYYKCDVRSREEVMDVVSKSSPDVILYMASTRYSPSPKYEKDHFDINVGGLVNTIEAIKNTGNKSKLFFVNSGAADQVLLTEPTLNSNPLYNSYSQSKFEASRYFMNELDNDLKGAEMRLYTPYGPWDYKDRLIQSTVISLKKGIKPTINSPNSQRDFIYISDVIDAIVKLILLPDVSLRLLKIGSTEPRKVSSVVKNIYEIMDITYDYKDINEDKIDQISFMKSDSLPTFQNLNWKPKIGFGEGLNKTIKWILNHMDSYL